MRKTLATRLLAMLAGLLSLPAPAQQPPAYPQFIPVLPGLGAPNPWTHYLPASASGSFLTLPFAGMPIPLLGTLQPKPTRAYTMRPTIPPETKRQMMQMMMPMMTSFMRMDMPDAMNWFAHKYKAKPGLTFDDVVESMMLRANQLNFKFVGSNLMWKDFHAVLGDKESPRIEVHSFCDIAVGRDLLKISPEFLVFLPCRIAIMEDADKNIWVMMLDWSMDWVAGYEGTLGLSPELIQGAVDIRVKMDNIMRAAANGEL
ncbi:MAG TPA: DUF302 domain-containing protein [Thiobacillaceae bacterium]|nr:DUF302 domain-containing protein [Thiobacillaceae bacterium]